MYTTKEMMGRLDLQMQKKWKTKYLLMIVGQSLPLIGSTAAYISNILTRLFPVPEKTGSFAVFDINFLKFSIPVQNLVFYVSFYPPV